MSLHKSLVKATVLKPKKQVIRVIRVNVWNVLASTAQIYYCIKAKKKFLADGIMKCLEQLEIPMWEEHRFYFGSFPRCSNAIDINKRTTCLHYFPLWIQKWQCFPGCIIWSEKLHSRKAELVVYLDQTTQRKEKRIQLFVLSIATWQSVSDRVVKRPDWLNMEQMNYCTYTVVQVPNIEKAEGYTWSSSPLLAWIIFEKEPIFSKTSCHQSESGPLVLQQL